MRTIVSQLNGFSFSRTSMIHGCGSNCNCNCGCCCSWGLTGLDTPKEETLVFDSIFAIAEIINMAHPPPGMRDKLLMKTSCLVLGVVSTLEWISNICWNYMEIGVCKGKNLKIMSLFFDDTFCFQIIKVITTFYM